MRAILIDDLMAAARAVVLVAPARQSETLACWLEQAHAADLYRKRLGKLHPAWGNGALGGRARCEPLYHPRYYDGWRLEALGMVLAAIQVWRRRGFNLPRPSPIWGETYVIGSSEAKEPPMAKTHAKVAAVDPVWTQICEEAEDAVRNEPLLGALIHAGLLHHPSFERALAFRFSLKLASGEMSEQILREIADEAYSSDPTLGQAARADLVAVYDRDPACHRFIQPILFFKGYQALQSYRIAHWLWRSGRTDMAFFVQMRTSEMFGVDIHPAARIGRGVMIDHAHSIVIGETAVVGDDVSMLHSVTLGGTGKEDQDRHPKIGNGVLIGAGAKVLGNIRVGDNSRIAAGSVVLADVPCCKTVAGVPAKIVGEAGCEHPSVEMDQRLRGCDCEG
ncbi:serine O-acetyltransferase [Rhodobacter aestuarii]|uniref:Serine acetyltransferase n=2 Tax=Rhodobacter group TaxID=3374108 RepID=A0A1N7J6E3_9RHOB|nr:serine O-acetyltransferase [Rhodobacter aestuarii]SIS44900.1 serine O-acetyltransferase [Rhodobacter aestuarii]